MLGDIIRNLRRENDMSQDELADKLGVSRQSISLWETGQTQPSLDNIVSLASIFNVSTDTLLRSGDAGSETDNSAAEAETENGESDNDDNPDGSGNGNDKKKIIMIAAAAVAVIVIVVLVILLIPKGNTHGQNGTDKVTTPFVTDESREVTVNTTEFTSYTAESEVTENNDGSSVANTAAAPANEEAPVVNQQVPVINQEVPAVNQEAPVPQQTPAPQQTPVTSQQAPAVTQQTTTTAKKEEPPKKDLNQLHDYFKNFVVTKGTVKGDYCYYSKPADTYGGYSSEDFSLSYWGDTDTVEFCLHSVLDDTFSINFYLRIPKQYTGEYEYISSYYYRSDGVPLYEAKGKIKAGEFTSSYPLYCDKYTGSADDQTTFMEMSRVGICDLLTCLKNFLAVEKTEYTFTDLGFVKF